MAGTVCPGFLADGRDSGAWKAYPVGLPVWPANAGAEGRVMVLGPEARMGEDPFAGLYPILKEE